MATYVSVIYHRWSSKCFAMMATAEEILARVGLADLPSPEELERLETQTRELIAESQSIRSDIDTGELTRIAKISLGAAERLREITQRTVLDAGNPLRELYDEFSDQAEVFALSVDPQIEAAFETALTETGRGELTLWSDLRHI